MSPPTDVTSLGAFVYPGCCKRRGPCLSSLLLFGGDTPQPARATDTPISSAYWDPKATEVTWGPRASSAPARAPFRSLRLLATAGLPWGCVPQLEAPGWLLWSRLRMPIALPASLPKKCIPCAHLFSVKETGARVCPRPRPWGGRGEGHTFVGWDAGAVASSENTPQPVTGASASVPGWSAVLSTSA